MSTLARKKLDVKVPVRKKRISAGHFGRKIRLILMGLLAGLVALVSLLAVALLPFATTVPLALCLLLTLVDMGLLVLLVTRAQTIWPRTVIFAALVAVSVLAVLLSQWYATTPSIVGVDGQPLPGSIAELESVELNGRHQWISVRGHNVNKPVLLFLAGGPGGSQLAATRKLLGGLEEHFVVVNWDQPGAGKSYHAAGFDTLTPEQYVADAHELTLYLRQRFDEEKIYILGESWGSLLGVWMVQRYPEHYHAFVGAAQMVAFLETDTYDYNLALQIAKERGDTGKIKALEAQGLPPYYGEGVAMKATEYLLYLSGCMNENSEIHSNYDTFGDIAAPEYGLYDKVNYVRGLLKTMNVLWSKLWEVDLREQVPAVDVPVYFLEGRHDVNAPPALVEDYLQTLDAPHKELIWFEHSGHSPWVEESAKAVDVLVNKVMVETYPPAPDASSYEGYFDTKLPKYLHEFGIAGAVVAVVQDGRPVHLGGYGFANLEQNIPMDPEHTIVHIGSAGKTFTAIGVMQLVEQGLIDLDADVTTYLDFEIPATFPQPITIRHLLTHTAGFEAHDLGGILYDDKGVPPTREYLIRNLPDRVRPPGEASGYSNFGLGLLGYVVERVSGMPLSDYLESSILSPLGMTYSSAQMAPAGAVSEHIAVGYEGLRPQPAEYVAVFGAAPVRSTAADMAKYMTANLQLGRFGNGQILRPDTAQAMQMQQFAAAPGLNGIGFGFYEMSRNGQRILGHLGATTYFHSLMLLLPERQLGVFVSFNSAEGARVLRNETFMQDFMENFFPQTVTAIAPPAGFGERADDYAGTYFWNNLHGQSTIEKLPFLLDAVSIRPTSDHRLRFASAGMARTYTESGPDEFVRSDGQDKLVFHRDQDGKVKGASVSNRAVFTLERRPWFESPTLTMAIIIGAGLVFLAALLVNGIHIWLSRSSDASMTVSMARWSAFLMPSLNLAFLLGLALLLPSLFHETPTLTLRLVLLLPIIGVVLTLVLAAFLSVVWIQGFGPLYLRLEYTVLVTAGAIFAVVLYIWNLLGWRF